MGHNATIARALNQANSIRASTTLQDAMKKVRRARTRSEEEFELALGEMWILTSDAFKLRNDFAVRIKHLLAERKGLEAEIEALKFELNNRQS